MILQCIEIAYGETRKVPAGMILHSWVDYDKKSVICLFKEHAEGYPNRQDEVFPPTK